MKHIRIDDTMFGQTLHLVVNCGPEDFNNLVYKKTTVKTDADMTDDASYFSVSNEDGEQFAFIYMQKFDKATESIGLLIHEIYHHVNRSLKYIGIRNEETTAYYLQYFIIQALNKLA